MKNKTMGLCLVLLAVILVMVAALLSQKRASEQLAARLKEANQTITATRNILQSSADTARQLEGKVILLSTVLSNSTERLNEATIQLNRYSTGNVTRAQVQTIVTNAPQLTPEQLTELMAQVHAPTIKIVTNKSGVTTRIYHFDELTGANDKALAQDVDFGDIYGRRLVFRREGAAPLSFDVDDLHPGELAHLQIDAYAAKMRQLEIDEKRQLANTLNQQNIAARRAAEQKAYDAIQAANAEYARLQEQKRQALIDQDLKYKQVENERLKAEAAMRQAEAAMVRARNPQPILVTPTGIINPNLDPNVKSTTGK